MNILSKKILKIKFVKDAGVHIDNIKLKLKLIWIKRAPSKAKQNKHL